MKHIIYKTENLINGKIYIGYHASENIDDSYIGSGKLLKKAIAKYGLENFKKEILYVFPSREEALLKETELVSIDFVKSNDNYNLKVGGEGGWDHINERLKNDIDYKKEFYKNHGHIIKNLYKEGKLIGWSGNFKHNNFKGKSHSEKSRKLISENNGNKIPANIIKERIEDYNKIEKTWGWISILSAKWGISHTQVKRFIDNI
jgi:hypothetical protein